MNTYIYISYGFRNIIGIYRDVLYCSILDGEIDEWGIGRFPSIEKMFR